MACGPGEFKLFRRAGPQLTHGNVHRPAGAERAGARHGKQHLRHLGAAKQGRARGVGLGAGQQAVAAVTHTLLPRLKMRLHRAGCWLCKPTSHTQLLGCNYCGTLWHAVVAAAVRTAGKACLASVQDTLLLLRWALSTGPTGP